MTDEDNIRFGLSLDRTKPFVDAVLDRFDEVDNILQRERTAYKAEIAKLRTENQDYKQAYFDQWYNNAEIEKCWAIIGGYNRKHLELHEAIREYIRNKEWNYEENLHCQPDPVVRQEDGICPVCRGPIIACDCANTPIKKRDECTCCRSGYESFACPVHSRPLNSNFPPHSTEQQIKGR